MKQEETWELPLLNKLMQRAPTGALKTIIFGKLFNMLTFLYIQLAYFVTAGKLYKIARKRTRQVNFTSLIISNIREP